MGTIRTTGNVYFMYCLQQLTLWKSRRVLSDGRIGPIRPRLSGAGEASVPAASRYGKKFTLLLCPQRTHRIDVGRAARGHEAGQQARGHEPERDRAVGDGSSGL